MSITVGSWLAADFTENVATSQFYGTLDMSGTTVTAPNAYGIINNPTFGSGATTGIYANWNRITTQAAAFTCTDAHTMYLRDPSLGGGSAITNLYGLYIADHTVGATLNYAIYTNDGLVSFGGDVYPKTDSALDLGKTGLVWAEVWADAIKSDNAISITPTGDLTLVLSDADDTLTIQGKASDDGGSILINEAGGANTTRLHIFPYDADNVSICFDAWWDSGFKSSDVGSNFCLYKTNDTFRIRVDDSVALGGVITWADALSINTSLDATFGHDILPDVDSSNDLGRTNFVWAEVWADAIKSDGALTLVPSTYVSGTLYPRGPISYLGADDNPLKFTMSDDAWGYVSWHINAGTRRAYLGPSADMTDFVLAGENSCDQFFIHGMDVIPGTDSALDLGMTGKVWAEVWTDALKSDGALIISPATSFNSTVTIVAAAPTFIWYETGVAADEKIWEAYANASTLYLQAFTDAYGAGTIWCQVDRTAEVVDSITGDYMVSGRPHGRGCRLNHAWRRCFPQRR
jgi:hypothetical protein